MLKLSVSTTDSSCFNHMQLWLLYLVWLPSYTYAHKCNKIKVFPWGCPITQPHYVAIIYVYISCAM